MNADIQAKLDAIKAPFQSVIDATDAVPALVDAAEKAKYDEGYNVGRADGIEEGKAMIQLPSPTLPDGTPNPDLIYTQQQLNDAVTAGKEQQKAEDQVAIDALNAQITEKDGKIANLENQVAQFETLKAEAIAAFKAELLAEYEAQQVAEAQGETGFGSLLK